MKVIAFMGSARVGGNTELMLEEALKPIRDGGHETTLFRLNFMNLKPCQNCGGCEQTGTCIITKDDMDEIYQAIREADRVILATPIYFFTVSAQTKTMIDRCQAFWCEKYLMRRPIAEGPLGRKGLLLMVGGMKKEIGIKCAGETAKAFFRTISVPTHESLGYLGVDAKAQILEHPTALKEIFEAGRKLIAAQ